MKKQVHPVVAVLIVAVALVAIWYSYTYVFTSKTVGQVGTPASVRMHPPTPGLTPPHGGAQKPPEAGASGSPKGGTTMPATK